MVPSIKILVNTIIGFYVYRYFYKNVHKELLQKITKISKIYILELFN